MTTRPSPLPAEVARLLDDLVAGGARTLRLQPLQSAEMALLARKMLAAPPGPALTAMLAKAGGNPLWAVAILRSLVDGGMLRRDGDTKFVLDRSSGEILGEHILARHGADLLPGPMVAMHAPGGTLAPLLATIHPHPTLSEAIKIAARDG